MSNLTDLIKALYEDISDGEANLAADNLLILFKILEQTRVSHFSKNTLN